MSLRDELWELVPAVYRERDAEANQGGALRALIDVLGDQAEVVAEDLARLYDNWFIETCEPWVVPYLGALLGSRPLHQLDPEGPTPVPRAYVANTVAYRRRKGTPAVLEQLARDVTGWPARVVEFFELLATTQHLNHRRLHNVRTPDLRRAARLDELGGPFEGAAHLGDARRPATGRYGIPNVGLFIWRLEPFQLFRVEARPVEPADGRFHVDPTGLDIALFNPPRPEETITSLAKERHVPGPLRRRALFDELEARRAGQPVDDESFFGVDPVLEIFADTGAGLQPLPPEQVTAADLSDPPPAVGVTTGWRRPAAPVAVAVDPILGRLAFRDGVVPTRVEVSSCYAFGGRVGAGPFDRTADTNVSSILDSAAFVRAVGSELPPAPGLVTTTLTGALADWSAQPAGTVGVIAVLDNRTQRGPFTVTVPAGSALLITAGSWPQVETGAVTPDAPAELAQLQLDEHRPHLRGDITVEGGAGGGPALARGRLAIDGLLVEGELAVAGDLGALHVAYCTVVPGRGGLEVTGNRDLQLTILRSITGRIRIPGEGPELTVDTSIVDGGGGVALDAAHAAVQLIAVSALGDARCRMLHATDCLITGALEVTRAQEGCVRFSYIGAPVRTPRRYRCQPDLALVDAPDRPAVRARLVPQLVSDLYGDPGYAQLADRSAPELLTGSSRHSDIGVFGHLLRPRRMANLATALDEYLRFGLLAGVIPVT